MSAEQQLHKLLDEGNFPKAIELCLDTRSTIEKYKYFDVVEELNEKVQVYKYTYKYKYKYIPPSAL